MSWFLVRLHEHLLRSDRTALQYCLELSYDGAPYFGWQAQPHRNTVQDVVEAALRKIVGDLPQRLVAASRTDSGVHAAQQFATFRCSTSISCEGLRASLAAVLPPSICIIGVSQVEAAFHPRHDAVSKIYRYRLLCRPGRDGELFADQWRLYRRLDRDCLAEQLRDAVGTHDFTSFCAGDARRGNRRRTLTSAAVVDQGEGLELWFEGPGFLKQMLRILVGTAVDRSTARPGAPSVAAALSARNRLAAGRVAPAQGLTLMRVTYATADGRPGVRRASTS